MTAPAKGATNAMAIGVRSKPSGRFIQEEADLSECGCGDNDHQPIGEAVHPIEGNEMRDARGNGSYAAESMPKKERKKQEP